MTAAENYSELTRSFEAHDVDTTMFNHAAHIKVAVELLNKYDFIDATAIYAKGIRAIAAKASAVDKFNLTITYAFMSLIAERMAGSSNALSEFIELNPDLMHKDVLSKWYAPDRLQTATARSIFLLPEPKAVADMNAH